MNIRVRIALAGAAVVTTGALAACGAPSFVDVPETPGYVEPQYVQGPPPAYAPPAPPQAYAQQPPQAYAQQPQLPPYTPPPQQQPQQRLPQELFSMAPIPNPEDLSDSDYNRIYGPGERARAELDGAPAASRAKPVAPNRAQTLAQSAPSRRPAPAPSARTQPPANPAPAPAARTQAPANPTPARPVRAAPPAATDTPPARLGQSLSAETTEGARLDIPPAIAEGQTGIVVLTLPPTLGERLRAEAEKLGLAIGARTAEVRARLTGDGYTILPEEEQTARLKDGESTSFSWQVQPGEHPTGALTADVSGALTGRTPTQTFDIAKVEGPAAPVAAPGRHLSQTAVTFGLLALLVVFLLAVFANRRSSDRKAREAAARRQARQDTDRVAAEEAAAREQRKARKTRDDEA